MNVFQPVLSFPGMQHRLVEECERDRDVTRVLSEPDRGVALPLNVKAGDADGSHHAGAVPGGFSRRAGGNTPFVYELVSDVESVSSSPTQCARQAWPWGVWVGQVLIAKPYGSFCGEVRVNLSFHALIKLVKVDVR
jgi:hypothetical protein